MKEKKLPAFIKNPMLYKFFQSRIGRLFSNWVLQGMLYMNPVEILYKLFVDLIIIFGLIYFLEINSYAECVVAIFFAHTVNWIINCQPVALLMHIDIGKNDAERFIAYIEGLHKRIVEKKYIHGAAAYGSLSMGNYKPSSDIDIRVVMKKDILSRIKIANFCFFERLRAFLHWFPLDLYAFEFEELKQKMSPQEPPIIFHDPDNVLVKEYVDIVDFNEFVKQFYENVIPAHRK